MNEPNEHEQIVEDTLKGIRFFNEGGSCFEICDYEGMVKDLRSNLSTIITKVRKEERERLIEILERTKDRIDCDKPTCDTCNGAIARNAGLNSAIRRVREQ